MPDETSNDRVMVLSLLRAAGITATDDDVAAMAAGYADSRRMMGLLYALADARYEVPATTFDPRVRWS